MSKFFVAMKKSPEEAPDLAGLAGEQPDELNSGVALGLMDEQPERPEAEPEYIGEHFAAADGMPHPSTQESDGDGLTQLELMKLVQRVFLSSRSHARKAVVFCGVERGVGCSWICTHAAEALAAHNQGTVCLVDANLRSPTQHEHFAVDQLPGLSDCIFESGPIQRFINTTSVPNLWLLTSGSTTGDPHVLLSCDVMKERIAELRSEFDFVLIDTAAGLAYSDAILLSQIVDGTVLALQSNSTRRQTAIRAKENLEAANATILGAVLNKRTFPIPQRIYSKL